MHPPVLQDNTSNQAPDFQSYAPLTHLFMPLQPRRTWSAEDERRRRLEDDADAYDVGPHSVTCAGCHRPIRLNATGRYYAANWNKHKMGCKNTNALNGAGAMSAESKFTGRVAAFRVAKPAEVSAPLPEATFSGLHHSPTSPSGHWHVHRSTGEQRATRIEQGLKAPANDRWYEDGDIRDRQFLSHSRKETAATYAQSRALGGIIPRLNSRNSPMGRTLRDDGSELDGRTNTPFRAEPEWDGRHSHGTLGHVIRLSRDSSLPMNHSQSSHDRAAYRFPQKSSSEHERVLQKGKEPHYDAAPGHPTSSQRLASPSTGYRSGVCDGHTWLINSAKILDPRYGQPTVSEAGSPLNSTRSRIDGRDPFDLDNASNATCSEPNSRTMRRSRSNLLQDVYPNENDEHILPPLRSLSLLQEGISSGTSMTSGKYDVSGSKGPAAEFDSSSNLEQSPVWRQRTRAWVRATTAGRALGREIPESMVLPPIRSASIDALEGPAHTKRRQRESGEPDEDSSKKDRPSPAKGSATSPFSTSRSSSTPRPDDLSFKYKRADASFGEDMNVGGDSIFVGNLDQSKSVRLIQREDSGRLHPVWKWEVREGDGKIRKDTTKTRGID